MNISKIILYDEPSIPEICILELSKFITTTFKTPVETRDSILKYSKSSTPKEIASTRIFDTRKPFERHNPTLEEISFEEKNTVDTSKTENIVMYDGIEIKNIIEDLIPKEELFSDILHIVFTNKLTCTYDSGDYRYHGRALIGSNPAIISTTGIIEAPAKPRQYYMDLITNMTQGLNVDSVKKKFSGTYLEYHDQRLSEVIKGYLMQAIFYYISGTPFCNMLECRLFNAHWQKDLLYSQLESGKLCQKHQKMLEDFVNNLN